MYDFKIQLIPCIATAKLYSIAHSCSVEEVIL